MSKKEAGVSGAEERQDYYAEGRSWAQEREAAQRSSARRAWIIAGVATGIAALEALALIALAPLKTVVPYTLLVDRNTGFVQALDGVHPQTIRPDSALVQSLLAQYVIAREGYDVATVADQFHKVSLWSAEAARQDYLALMPASNPQGPIARYGRNARMVVTVESVSPMGPQVGAQGQALVRFTTARRDVQGDSAAQPSYWVAVIHYRFAGDPQKIEDRLVNPLGFQVTAYRRDQEAAPVAEPAPAPSATGVTQPEAATARATTPASAALVEDEPTPQRTRPATPWRAAQPLILQQRPQYNHPQIVQPGGGEP